MNKAFYDLIRKVPAGRWDGIKRVYGPDIVRQLRSGVEIEYTLAVSIFEKKFSLIKRSSFLRFEYTRK